METDVNGKMASPNKRPHKEIPFVNEEFKRILEEYLSRRDYSVNRTRSELPPKSSLLRHQKIIEANITEKRNAYHRSDSYQRASLESILDGSEDSDNGLNRRSRTMPSVPRSQIVKRSGKTKEYTGELLDGKEERKKKSGEKDKDSRRRKTSVHKRDDKISHSSSTSDRKDKSKPIRGVSFSGKPSSQSSEYTDKKSKPIRGVSFSGKPGSESSENTDTESLVSFGRKKKSFMKRTKERLTLLLKRDKEKKEKNAEGGYEQDDDCYMYDKDGDKQQKPKKKDKSKEKRADVLGEVHTHGTAHLKQTTDNINHIILRTGEKHEEIDIEVNGKKKHIEQHIKLKESTDDGKGSSKTFIDSLKRPFSRRHSKKNISESKSAEFPTDSHANKKDYCHSVSVPDDRKNEIHVKIQNTDTIPGKKITHVFEESVDKMEVQGEKDANCVNKFVEIDTFDDFIPSPTGSSHRTIIPKGGSFEMDIDYDVDEKYLPGGRVVRNFSCEESKTQKNDLPDQPTDKKETDAKKPITEEEREKIYERIAAKLTEIGDSYVQQLESEVDEKTYEGSDVDAVACVHSTSEPMDLSPECTVDGRLNSLEQKLVYHLRGTGDKIAEQSQFPEVAAKEIVKEATYNNFKSTVKNAVGESVGQYQLAMFLHLTKTAVRIAGTGGAVATHIKEMSLRYFEDKFASWIVNQGGWESVLEDDDSELD